MSNKVSRITAVIKRGRLTEIVHALKVAGVQHMHSAAGRAPVLQERKGILAVLGSDTDLASDPVDVLTFMVDQEREDQIIALISEVGRLQLPGMGSVFSEEVTLIESHNLCGKNTNIDQNFFA